MGGVDGMWTCSMVYHHMPAPGEITFNFEASLPVSPVAKYTLIITLKLRPFSPRFYLTTAEKTIVFHS